MSPVLIREANYARGDGGWAVSVPIRVGVWEHELRYRVSSGEVARGPEPFVAAALVAAMRTGEPLQVCGAMSPRMLRSISTVQDILHLWDRRLSKIAIEAEVASTSHSAAPKGVACFFSGGVDSFYSVLKHHEEITHLVFVHGFDIFLHDAALRDKVSRAIRSAAAELGKPLIEVETNVRELTDQYGDWRDVGHGPAMASVALLLSPQFARIYFASTRSYDDLVITGSHPVLDPLWSTETMEVVHDGCEATRFEKMAQIVSSETVLKWLRVCWENPGGAYNCCRCEKCLRTMSYLRALGALEHCPAFELPLDLSALARLVVPSVRQRWYREILEILEHKGIDHELAEAVRQCLEDSNANPGDERAGLRRQLQEREAEITALKELVAGYERGRVMRLLSWANGFRRRA